MGILTKLDVVNEMLGALGEVGLNSLVNAPPIATDGLNILRTVSSREQGQGWWFNTEAIELVPDASGKILLPTDILKIDPVKPQLNFAQRGKYLYKLTTRRGEDPYKFDGPIFVQIVRLVDFEDLPATVQSLISISAQLDFISDKDGDTLKIDKLFKERREAQLTVRSEHISAVDANLLMNPSTLATLGSLKGGGTGRIRIR